MSDRASPRFTDVAPLRSQPRIRWTKRFGDAPLNHDLIVASPRAVVCTARDDGVQVLEPETGELRWEIDWEPGFSRPPSYQHRWPEVVDDSLVGWAPPFCIGWDLQTGQERYRIELPHHWRAHVVGDRLVGVSSNRVVSYPFDRLHGPTPTPIWTTPSPFPGGFSAGSDDFATSEHAIVVTAADRRSIASLEPATGAVRFHAIGAAEAVDEAGLLVAADSASRPIDHAGRPGAWTRPNLQVLAAAPGFAFGSIARGLSRELVIIDRQTGATRASLGGPLADWGAIAIARDVIFECSWRLDPRLFEDRFNPEIGMDVESGLRATTGDGVRLWEIPEDVLGPVMSVAPMPDRLYGMTHHEAFCAE